MDIGLIVKKELSFLLNEKTIVLVIIIQLFVALFSSFLVVGLVALYSPDVIDIPTKVRIGVVGDSTFLDGEKNIRVINYNTKELALRAFYNRRIDGVVEVPILDPGGEDIFYVNFYLPKGEILSTLVILALKEPLKDFQEHLRVVRKERIVGEPIGAEISETDFKETLFEFTFGMIVPLLLFTPAFISGGIVIDSITEEMETKTLDILITSPLSFLGVISGKVAASIVIAPIQAAAWIVLLRANGIVIENIFLVLVLITSITAILVLLAAIISVYTSNRGVSQFHFSLILISLIGVILMGEGSPFNSLVIIATSESFYDIGTDIWMNLVVYLVVIIPLFLVLRQTCLRVRARF